MHKSCDVRLTIAWPDYAPLSLRSINDDRDTSVFLDVESFQIRSPMSDGRFLQNESDSLLPERVKLEHIVKNKEERENDLSSS